MTSLEKFISDTQEKVDNYTAILNDIAEGRTNSVSNK